jgi:hypothetical protein
MTAMTVSDENMMRNAFVFYRRVILHVRRIHEHHANTDANDEGACEIRYDTCGRRKCARVRRLQNSITVVL